MTVNRHDGAPARPLDDLTWRGTWYPVQHAFAPYTLRLGATVAVSYLLLGAELASVSPALVGVMEEFGVGPSTVGTIFSASSLGAVLASLAYAPVARRVGLRSTLLLGGLGFAMGMGLVSAAPPFGAVLAGFFVTGAGFSLMDIGMNAAILAARPRRPGLIMNWLHFLFALGAAIAPLFLPAVMAQAGWRAPYGGMAAVAAMVAVAFALRYTWGGGPGPEAGAATVEPATLQSTTRGAALLRLVLGPAVAAAVYVGVEVAVSGWSFSYLALEAGASPAVAGLGVSLFWGGLAAGRLLLAPLVDRLGHALSATLGAIAGGLSMAAMAAGVGPAGAVIALLGTGFFIGIIFPTVLALAARMDPARSTAITAALFVTANSGSMVLPAGAGLMAESLGLRGALGVLALILPAGVLVSLGRLSWQGLRGKPSAAPQGLPATPPPGRPRQG